jgi:sugar/nucleoside kinase (ribokinase family)
VLEYAKQKGVTVTFDQVAVNRPDLADIVVPCMPYVDYFMPGFEEAVMMSKLTDRRDVIRFFLEAGAKHTVFKMGGEGSSIAWEKDGKVEEIRVPTFKVPVVDSTGCGDAYCAGFITGLSMGWGLEQAALLGTAAAGLVITGLGSDAGIVNLEKTIEFMNGAERNPLIDDSAACGCAGQ